MSNTPLRVGLIGLGAIGQRVAKGMQADPNTTVVAVCDSNPELAQSTAAALNAAWSTDYRSMLAGDQVDLVYIGVPPRLHHAIALDVIAAGKHIFCEKPLALTLPEAREMTERAQAAGLTNGINITMALNPNVREFGRLASAGYLGELRRVEIDFVFPQWPRAWQQNPWIGGREQGGPIRECAPHLLYPVLRYLGRPVRVLADMQYPPHDAHACEVGASGVIELADGARVVLNAVTNVPRPESVTLTAYGTDGTLGFVEWARLVGSKDASPLQPLPVTAEPVTVTSVLAQAVRGEEPVAELPDFAMGLAIQQVLDAWERSARSGRWEQIDP